MDFGLAGPWRLRREAARDARLHGAENLAGRHASARSDAPLGLLLYELFTGKPAFSPTRWGSRCGCASIHTRIRRATCRTWIRRRAGILRCRRAIHEAPRDAVLAAALPGGDPPAAAIAAVTVARDGRRGWGRRRMKPAAVGLSGTAGMAVAAISRRASSPWTRAAGEAARSPCRTVEGHHPEARAAEKPRHRVGFPATASTGAGSSTRTSRKGVEGHGGRASCRDLLLVPAEPRPLTGRLRGEDSWRAK